MSKGLNRRLAIYLIILTAGIYCNTLFNDFVAGGRQFILGNRFVGDIHAVLKSFTSDYWGILGGESFVYFRPLPVLTHFIDFKIYGLNPVGHHFSNIIFHTAATLLLYRLFCCLLPLTPWAAFAGSALFALHPVHTHSVSYVMGRTDMLAAIFYLLGLILLIDERHKTAWSTMWGCLFYFLALLCKEIAITLPAIFLLCRIFRTAKSAGQAKKMWPPFCYLCFTALIYFVFRLYAVGLDSPEIIPPGWYNIWQRLSLIFITFGFYIVKLLLPLNLCYYSNIVVPGTLGEAVSSKFFITGTVSIIALLIFMKTAPRLSFTLGWILLTLLPVLNIIQLPVLAKENYLYIPSIGFCLLLSIMAETQIAEKKYSYCIIIFLSLGILYGAGTYKRNRDYRNPLIFLMTTLDAMEPIPVNLRDDVRYFEGMKNFYTTYRNLGRLYMEAGLLDKASDAFENSLAYIPAYFSPEYTADIKISLGKIYDKTGKFDKAVANFNDVLSITSRPFYINNLLGVVYIKLNEIEKAETCFKKAIEIKDDYAPSHYNLGVLYMKLNMPEKAKEHLNKAAQLNPGYKKALPGKK